MSLSCVDVQRRLREIRGRRRITMTLFTKSASDNKAPPPKAKAERASKRVRFDVDVWASRKNANNNVPDVMRKIKGQRLIAGH